MPNLETGKFEPLITGDDNGALTKDEEMQFRNMVRQLTNKNMEKNNPRHPLLISGAQAAQDLQVCEGAECEGDGGR